MCLLSKLLKQRSIVIIFSQINYMLHFIYRIQPLNVQTAKPLLLYCKTIVPSYMKFLGVLEGGNFAYSGVATAAMQCKTFNSHLSGFIPYF